jgi:uncharacterized protein YPO0396
MDDLFLRERSEQPGFRLHKLELSNWGTFDSTSGTFRGRVYTARPRGQTTLLIGQNGSGKSTLVDGLLTLLVRPVVRNYNVAAGSHKQERDERTYIKGACGRFSREDDNRAQLQYLRPDAAHYSILLAYFHNTDSGRGFTIVQLLYLNADGGPEKIYGWADGERSLAADFSALASREKIKKQLTQRGYRATTSYADLHAWLTKETGIRAKAMDMFNQTVAVKDIRSLNDFIRQHMLEAVSWRERIEGLLGHFTQLSEAHRSLVRVREQRDLLAPVAKFGKEYRQQRDQYERLQRLLDAADSYFRQQTITLFGPRCDQWQAALVAVAGRIEQLDRELEQVLDRARRLQNEIDLAGGERLREIPLLIKELQAHAAAKRQSAERYQRNLRLAGIHDSVLDADQFAVMGEQLAQVMTGCQAKLAADEAQRNALLVEISDISRLLGELQRELDSLRSRQGNLPDALAELRHRLCHDLGLKEKSLPFVAELVAVKTEERKWESAIEKVLRTLALTMLVPERHYVLISRYVEQTRLSAASGRGQRLVYVKVGQRRSPEGQEARHPQSLLHKLRYRDGAPFLPWVQAELAERFDFRCCASIEEFQAAQPPALTQNRHVKLRGHRHEKDDREQAVEARYFVLGWDNRAKCRLLAAEIERLSASKQLLDAQAEQLAGLIQAVRQRALAATQAAEVADFGSIDFQQHEYGIAALEDEQRRLEAGNETVQLLKQQLAAAKGEHVALQRERDDAIRHQADLRRDLGQAQHLMANAQAVLRRRAAVGSLTGHAAAFAELDACFAQQPLVAEQLLDREKTFGDSRRAELDKLRAALDPLAAELTKAMSRFLQKFGEETVDLQPGVEFLDSFVGLHARILEEDLPQHEARFKSRLNEKVTQEIGFLNGELQKERTQIADKIELLNRCLRQLPYREGTIMRLEPRPVHDMEIKAFQGMLKECLAGTFEGTPEADEARFQRIEKLIERLRDEERWRDKVTDVRRWYDFAAREIEVAGGAERSYHEDSAGQSGGEKAKLAFTILVAAIAYQYDLHADGRPSDRFHFVVVDEMFSKVDDQYAEYALELFRKFGLQLLIVAPLDAKARVTEPYVGCYLHVVKDQASNCSEIFSMTAREFEEVVGVSSDAALSSDILPPMSSP